MLVHHLGKTVQKRRRQIPYVHTVSHNLKKVAQRYDMNVVFSAPHKLSKLCKMTGPEVTQLSGFGKKHRPHFVECTGGVAYQIPLTCGKVYVGLTGRCVNARLREHTNNVKNA